jgi:surface polysaccharide O-acyltransferase-like enzyme
MDESSSDINIVPRTRVFYLTLYMVLGTTMRMSMLMKGEAHPARKCTGKTLKSESLYAKFINFL